MSTSLSSASSLFNNPYATYPYGTSDFFPQSNASSLNNTSNYLTQSIAQDNSAISGFGQLLSSLSSFSSALQSILQQANTPDVTLLNSNSSVALAFALPGSSSNIYRLAVSQQATPLTTESAAFSSPNNVTIGSGYLTITPGNFNTTSNTFTPNGNAASTTTHIVNGSLNSIASTINSADAGVNASVVQDSTGYHLVLTALSPGLNNGFTVSVQDDDGNDTNNSGLSQLAYNTSANDQTTVQSAQNANYTLNGVSAIGTSNSIQPVNGLSVLLQQPGSTTLQITTNNNAAQSTAQNLVNAYNSLQSTLARLTQGKNGLLANDPVTLGAIQNLYQTAVASYSNDSSSYQQLNQVGINVQPALLQSGASSATLNPYALQNALSSDANGTLGLISQVAQNLNTTSINYQQTASLVTQSYQEASLFSQTLAQFSAQSAPTSQFSSSLADFQLGSALGLSGTSLQAGRLQQLFSLVYPSAQSGISTSQFATQLRGSGPQSLLFSQQQGEIGTLYFNALINSISNAGFSTYA